MEWIQYQLDISATSEEVIQNSRKVAIVPVATPVHYLICDGKGNVVVLEFLDGRQIIRRGREVTIPVCSNMVYDKSKHALREYQGFGGRKPIPEHWTSVADIIAMASYKVKHFASVNNQDCIDYAFKILSAIGSLQRTQWSVVYDIKDRRIYYKTRGIENRHIIDLKELDFTCNNSIDVIYLNKTNHVTDVSQPFINLTRDVYLAYKKELIDWFKTHVAGFPEIPEKAIRAEVEYAFRRRCR